jgi:putative transposase
VLLPDQLHTIWTLPAGDSDDSRRWAFLKRSFSERWLTTGAPEARVTPGWRRQRRRGPVKHGLCRCPADWPHSSFQRFVRSGDYDANWGCSDRFPTPMDFSDIGSTAQE